MYTGEDAPGSVQWFVSSAGGSCLDLVCELPGKLWAEPGNGGSPAARTSICEHLPGAWFSVPGASLGLLAALDTVRTVPGPAPSLDW